MFVCVKEREVRGQFHQHSTRSFYVRKLPVQLFCAYILGLYFTGISLPAQKLRIEHWWNWAQVEREKIQTDKRRQNWILLLIKKGRNCCLSSNLAVLTFLLYSHWAIHKLTHTHSHTYTHTIHTHIHTLYTHTHTHTYTHTHTVKHKKNTQKHVVYSTHPHIHTFVVVVVITYRIVFSSSSIILHWLHLRLIYVHWSSWRPWQIWYYIDETFDT